MISDTDLQALIDAEAKATKGEWQWVDNDDAPVQPKKNGWSMARALFAHGMNHNVLDGQEYAIEGLWTDLSFIASLRNAAPSLLAELRASREIIKRLPTTADGVPLYPGLQVWELSSVSGRPVSAIVPNIIANMRLGWTKTYSTREAALASKGER